MMYVNINDDFLNKYLIYMLLKAKKSLILMI